MRQTKKTLEEEYQKKLEAIFLERQAAIADLIAAKETIARLRQKLETIIGIAKD